MMPRFQGNSNIGKVKKCKVIMANVVGIHGFLSDG